MKFSISVRIVKCEARMQYNRKYSNEPIQKQNERRKHYKQHNDINCKPFIVIDYDAR
jgi:hypothetical protein